MMGDNMTFEDTGCLALAPFSPCGTFASCDSTITEIDSRFFNQECVCDSERWQHTDEMLLYFLSPEEALANLGPCNLNPVFLKALYSLALILSFFVAVLQLSRIQRRKQLMRLAPLLLALFLPCTLSIYKLSAFERALLGKDFAAMFLYAEIAFNISASTVIFFEKYLLYLFKTLPFSAPNSISRFRQFQKINHILLVVDFLLYQFIWISVVVPQDLQTTVGNVVLRIGLGAMGARGFLFIAITQPVFKRFISDMDDLLDAKAGLKTNNSFIEPPPRTSSFASNFSIRENNKADEQMRVLEKLMKRTYELRRATLGMTSIVGVLFLATAIWEWMLLQLTYIVPFLLISWPITSYYAMRANSKTMKATPSKSRRVSKIIKKVTSKSSLLVRKLSKTSRDNKSGQPGTDIADIVSKEENASRFDEMQQINASL